MFGRLWIRAEKKARRWFWLAGLCALLVIILAACAASPEQQVQVQPTQAVGTVPTETGDDQMPEGTQSLRPLPVEAVTVQVGVGSPIPVDVVASGTWNDLCAQLARVEQKRDGNSIDISLSASAEQPCKTDNLGVPFRVAVPLNPVEMEIGEYQISVNGVETTFDWDPEMILSSRPTSEAAVVTHVGVEIGVDAPTSVNVVVSGEYPNTCAQMDSVDVNIAPGSIQIIVLVEVPPAATLAAVQCGEQGLPFRLSIPLNADRLEAGNYTIDANGQQNNFDWPPSSG